MTIHDFHKINVLCRSISSAVIEVEWGVWCGNENDNSQINVASFPYIIAIVHFIGT